jgi:hypothetical protein
MNEKHIATLLAQIREYNLDTDMDFKFEDIQVLSLVYNGCGPDWLSLSTREFLTDFFDFFEPAFLPHDWDFLFLPKNEKNFHRANRRLRSNCLRLINCKHHWWQLISRRRRKIQAQLIYAACEEFGFGGYMAALPEKLTEKYNAKM